MKEVTRRQSDIMLAQAQILDKNVIKILRVIEKIDRHNADIVWLKDQIKLGSNADPIFIINKVKTKFTDFADKIRECDDIFFATTKKITSSKYIKNDERKQFMLNFVQTVQKNILNLQAAEKEIIWKMLNEILDAVILYRTTDPNDPYPQNISSGSS
jgi:hypothetical protein